MKIPNSIRIQGVEYEIKNDEGPLVVDGRSCQAMIEYSKCLISILDDGTNHQKKCISLWHEAFHVIFANAEVDLGEDKERIIETAAKGAYQVLQDNGRRLFDIKDAEGKVDILAEVQC